MWMVRRNVRCTRRGAAQYVYLWLVLGAVLPFSSASAGDWPLGYVLDEGSRSPDGHYGITIPRHDPQYDGQTYIALPDDIQIANYLDDLKANRHLGKIKSDYIEEEPHRNLKVIWASDSRWCVVDCEDRYGFASISVLVPNGSHFTETDVGKHIQKALENAIADQPYIEPYFRLQTDRKLLVRAVTWTRSEAPYLAFFEGAYDLNSDKWTASTTRKISSEEGDEIQEAYRDYSPEELTEFLSADKTDYIEERLNQAYQGVRLILAPARFAEVKRKQIAWLKARDALGSAAEKSAFTQARIKELQNLLW
jgi:uncharacterized protein YecT (DUF1311 family)